MYEQLCGSQNLNLDSSEMCPGDIPPVSASLDGDIMRPNPSYLAYYHGLWELNSGPSAETL